jgi:hypothetical protein
MTRTAALGALLLALTAVTVTPGGAEAAPVPAPPARAGTGLGISSDALDVAMTSDGAAHVAYLTQADPLSPYVVHVCRIPAGGTTCTATADLTLDSDDTTGPWIVTDGTKVVVVVGNHDGAEERTFATASPDGTSAYSALSKVASVTARDVELAPTGDRLWIAAASGPMDEAVDYLAFTSAPLPGATTADAAVFTSTAGSQNVDGQLVGVSPDGRPVAFVSGSSLDFADGSYYRTYDGAATAEGPNAAASWGGLTRYDVGEPFERNGSYDVFSGGGRMWVAYEGLQRDTVLRQFAGGALGAPVAPDCLDSRFGSGTQDAPDVAISRTGDLLVTETGSNGSGMFLGFFHGTADGSKFSAYTELASAPGIRDVETAADPTTDSGGIVVWTADDIYGGPLSFARMPAAAPAACPPPYASTVPGKIGGATVVLTVPKSCVKPGKGYQAKVTKKKGKGDLARVVFTATKAKKVVDAKAPFAAKLKVKKGTASGSTIKVKAKVTVVPPKGKPATKTLKASFGVC